MFGMQGRSAGGVRTLGFFCCPRLPSHPTRCPPSPDPCTIQFWARNGQYSSRYGAKITFFADSASFHPRQQNLSRCIGRAFRMSKWWTGWCLGHSTGFGPKTVFIDYFDQQRCKISGRHIGLEWVMSPTTSPEWIFTNVRHVRVGAAQKTGFSDLILQIKTEQGSKLIYDRWFHPSRGLPGQSPRMKSVHWIHMCCVTGWGGGRPIKTELSPFSHLNFFSRAFLGCADEKKTKNCRIISP